MLIQNKINKEVNKVSLAKRIQKITGTGDSRYIYQNLLKKACFQKDVHYGDFKIIWRRTASDKLLRDKVFQIASYPKYDEYKSFKI